MNEKPKYNPQIHHRRSIRLRGYDYSQVGAYFVTICVQRKACLFGRIADETIILNDAGSMLDKWWQKIPEKFPGIELDEYQIMPYHFHGILINVGADPRFRPHSRGSDNTETNLPENEIHNVGADPRVRPHSRGSDNTIPPQPTETGPSGGGHTDPPLQNDNFGEHTSSSLWTAIQWFKTMATNEYIRNVKTNNWLPFDGKLFQRNYWEHVIRNENEYNKIAEYIRNNPVNWNTDKFYSD